MNYMDKLIKTIIKIEHLYVQWAKQQQINNINILYIYLLLTEHDNCSQQEICETFGLAKQTLSPLCQNLQQQNIIEIAPNRSDKREKRWQLTANGRQIAESVLQKMRDWERNAFAQLGADDGIKLVELTTRLVNALRENMSESVAPK